MSEYANGAARISKVLEEHSGKLDILENILIDGFHKLHSTMDRGFSNVANELKLTRESGFIPAPIVEKMLENQDKINNKNADKVYRILLVVFGSVLLVVLGLKAFFPHLLGG